MNKMIYLAIATSLLMVVYVFGFPKVDFEKDPVDGIRFHKGSMEDAMLRARQEHKLIFLDIYASWCGPCKRLKSTTFSNKEVGDYFNHQFVNIALDGEKGEGIQQAIQYHVTAYPTLLFLNADGEVIHRTKGYHNAKEMIELGKALNNVH